MDRTSDECRAFDFFRTNVANNLGGFFDTSFWNRDILQVAQHEPSVRHAIVAVASTSETWRNTALGATSASKLPEGFTSRQHHKAVSMLNQMILDSNEASPETVLMTVALLICFEMLQNHHEEALGQMASGVYAFFAWHSKHYRDEQMASRRTHGTSSELVVQLKRIFEILMLQIVLFVHTKPNDWHFLTPAFTSYDTIDTFRLWVDQRGKRLSEQLHVCPHPSNVDFSASRAGKATGQ